MPVINVDNNELIYMIIPIVKLLYKAAPMKLIQKEMLGLTQNSIRCL